MLSVGGAFRNVSGPESGAIHHSRRLCKQVALLCKLRVLGLEASGPWFRDLGPCVHMGPCLLLRKFIASFPYLAHIFHTMLMYC